MGAPPSFLPALFIGTMLSAAALPLQPTTWERTAVPELIIDAPPELQPVARALDRFDTSTLRDVMRLVGLEDPGDPIHVVLAGNDSDLARDMPDWVAGFAISRVDSVVLYPERSPSYPHDSLEGVLRHEIAHVLVDRAAGGRPVPRWFNEGIAMAAEDRPALTDRMEIALALVFGDETVPPVERFNAGGQTTRRAYVMAGAFVRDLLVRYGPTVVARILAQLAAGASFDTAFAQVTGLSVAEADREFRSDSLWYQAVPLLTSSAVLWMGVTALALFAIRKRRQHSAQMRRRWEEEERSEA